MNEKHKQAPLLIFFGGNAQNSSNNGPLKLLARYKFNSILYIMLKV